MELFSSDVPPSAQPLAARLAPKTLDDFVGQKQLLGPGKMLRRLVEAKRFQSAIFFGPPGVGKTGLARYIARQAEASVVELNAVAAGVADLKKALEQAKYSLSLQGERT